MKTQEIIFVVVLTLSLSSAGAYAQEQIPPEKLKELRKFDPADIVPVEREGAPGGREGEVGAERAQPRRSARVSVAATPTPPAATPLKAAQSIRTTPSLTPDGAVVPKQSPAPKTQSLEPAVTQARGPATSINRSTRSTRLSLPFIFFLLSLILLALGGIAVKLKNDLRRL